MAEVERIELGGGGRTGLPDRLNVDQLPGADLQYNLDLGVLPFPDDCCRDLYTAHCLEHVRPVHEIVGEILRICCIGARVEIRVPHWLHSMASCPGHHHVISDRQIRIWCEQPEAHPFPDGKRLRLVSLHYQPDVAADAFQRAFPDLHRQFIIENMPGCCHEVRAVMEVVER
jgi:hypothetical protein